MNTNKLKLNSSNKTLSSQAKNVAGAAIEKTKEAAEGIKAVGNKITNSAKLIPNTNNNADAACSNNVSWTVVFVFLKVCRIHIVNNLFEFFAL